MLMLMFGPFTLATESSSDDRTLGESQFDLAVRRSYTLILSPPACLFLSELFCSAAMWAVITVATCSLIII